MLSFDEFFSYVEDNVKDYLPFSYENARIQKQVVVKNNDLQLHAMIIRRENEDVAPTLYMESFYQKYTDGWDLDTVVGKVADARIENDVEKDKRRNIMYFARSNITNYDYAKEHLAIRLCDPELNARRLSDAAYTMEGDFAAVYYVDLANDENGIASVAVTQNLMSIWGVDAATLRQDALRAEKQRVPVFGSVLDALEGALSGTDKIENLLEKPRELYIDGEQPPLYVLTNAAKINGASMMLQGDVMEEIGMMFNRNYFILPSSVHEVLLFPDMGDADVFGLIRMVREVNEAEVSVNDLLSDKVQYYERGTGKIMNAVQHQILEEQKKQKMQDGKKKDFPAR